MVDPSVKENQERATTSSLGGGSGKPAVSLRAHHPGDENFQQSMADLSRRFGERDAQRSMVDPRAAAQARRVAMRDYERTRRHRLNIALAAAVAVIAIADLAYMLSLPDAQPEPQPSSPVAAAATQPAAPLDMALTEPAPAPRPSSAPEPTLAPETNAAPLAPPPVTQAPPQAASDKPAELPAPQDLPVQKADEAVQSPPPSNSGPSSSPAAATSPDTSRLLRDEIREVQARLREFGFNPGPVDGNAGPMTEAAAERYQQQRSQTTTGVDRELLDELRKDPAPKVAPRNLPPTRYASASSASPRYSAGGPLAAIRQASDRLSAWFQSITPR